MSMAQPTFGLHRNSSAPRRHYFALTRRENAGGKPAGVTVAFVLPSAVRRSVTVSPSDENADSFSSVR